MVSSPPCVAWHLGSYLARGSLPSNKVQAPALPIEVHYPTTCLLEAPLMPSLIIPLAAQQWFDLIVPTGPQPRTSSAWAPCCDNNLYTGPLTKPCLPDVGHSGPPKHGNHNLHFRWTCYFAVLRGPRRADICLSFRSIVRLITHHSPYLCPVLLA